MKYALYNINMLVNRNLDYENLTYKVMRSTKRNDNGAQICSDSYVCPGEETQLRSNYLGDYENENVKPLCAHDLICWSFQVSRGMAYLASRKVCF